MHLTQFTDQANIPEFIRSVPGLKWCSRFFNYQLKMLENLSPNGLAVSNPPFNNLPPPHLLIGYAYLFNVNNNYHFETRTYTRLKYESHIGELRRPRNFWSILSDCSYTIETGNVTSLSGPNFEENFLSTQETILANRIQADIQARENINLVGTGITLEPQAIENVRMQEELNSTHTKNLETFLNSHSFFNMQRYKYEVEKDLITLKYINYMIKTITNFLYLWKFCSQKIYVPFTESWLNNIFENLHSLNPKINQQYIKCFILANNAKNTTFKSWQKDLIGGAKLRSGTRTDLPIQLRQRQNQRAITESIRRNRGQIVQRFIDSLPLIRRIRRPPQLPEEQEEEPEAGPSALEEEEEQQEILGEEILRILQLSLNELYLELTEASRDHEIFNFGNQLYNLLQRANEEGRINAQFIRRFFFYFFILEHISSTLFYYHALFILNVPFRRYVNFNYIQVILTGRDRNGNVNLHRIWHNNNASPFLRIYRTILNNILLICNRPHDTEEEEESILTSFSHRPESGDPNDILQQARLREEEVNTVTVSFKLNPYGLVTNTTNRQIIANASAVRNQEMRRLRAPR